MMNIHAKLRIRWGTKNNYKIATQRQTRVFRSVRSLDKGFDTITLEWD